MRRDITDTSANLPPGLRNNRIYSWLFSLSFLGVVIIGCTVFVIKRGDVVLNRYTDATWHMAAAEEFATTGVFGKDPFFQEGPPFAPFGIWDFANGLLQRHTGKSPESIFVVSNAVTLSLFIISAYLAGVVAAGRPLFGVLSILAVSIASAIGQTTLTRCGWPFALAFSVYLLAVAVLGRFLNRVDGLISHVESERAWSKEHLVLSAHALLVGLLVGVVFAVHPFIAVFGGMALTIAVVPYIIFWRHHLVRLLLPVSAALAGFLAVSWPWLFMHIGLRGTLSQINAHIYDTKIPNSLFEEPGLIFAVCLAFCAVFIAVRQFLVFKKREPTLWLLGICGLVAVVASVPVISSIIGQSTSITMAERLPSLIPAGFLFVVLIDRIRSSALKPVHRMVVSLAIALGFLGSNSRGILKEAASVCYLWRTSDYDTHEYEDLSAMANLGLRGRLVLSDPFTSYFARRFIGVYAVTVPPQHASPAIDYPSRNAVWNAALNNPVKALGLMPFEYVLFNKKPRTHGKTTDAALIHEAISKWAEVADLIYEDDSYSLFRITSAPGDSVQSVAI